MTQLRETMAIRLQDVIGDHVSFFTYLEAADAALALMDVESLRTLSASQASRIAELEEGLKVFAKHYDILGYVTPGPIANARCVAVIDTSIEGDRYFHEIKADDLRRASKLLGGK